MVDGNCTTLSSQPSDTCSLTMRNNLTPCSGPNACDVSCKATRTLFLRRTPSSRTLASQIWSRASSATTLKLRTEPTSALCPFLNLHTWAPVAPMTFHPVRALCSRWGTMDLKGQHPPLTGTDGVWVWPLLGRGYIAGVADDLTGLPVQEIDDDQSAKHPNFVHPDGSHFISKLSKKPPKHLQRYGESLSAVARAIPDNLIAATLLECTARRWSSLAPYPTLPAHCALLIRKEKSFPLRTQELRLNTRYTALSRRKQLLPSKSAYVIQPPQKIFNQSVSYFLKESVEDTTSVAKARYYIAHTATELHARPTSSL